MEHTYTVALAGNHNVGKSTVFNRLTGLRQHTGNWPGKTVERAEGYFSQAGQRFRLVDLPGTYSLAADSPEEEVAGAFLQSGQADAVIVVVDASCLRRGLILALQLRQQTQRLVLPLALVHPAQGVKLLAWCELAQDFRQFFVRAMRDLTPQPGSFAAERLALLQGLATKEGATKEGA